MDLGCLSLALPSLSARCVLVAFLRAAVHAPSPGSGRVQRREIHGDDGVSVEAGQRLHHCGALVAGGRPLVVDWVLHHEGRVGAVRSPQNLRVDLGLLAAEKHVVRRGPADAARLQQLRQHVEALDEV